jgi:hypothetical protein
MMASSPPPTSHNDEKPFGVRPCGTTRYPKQNKK